MEKDFKGLIAINFPIILFTIIAEIIVFCQEDNSMDGVVIAIIGVISALIVNWVQLKKDTNKLIEVKTDTSQMVPQVESVSETTKDINQYLTRTVDKKIDSLMIKSSTAEKTTSEIIRDLKYVADEVRYKKRMEVEYMGQVSKEMISSGIENLYKENALLAAKVKEYEAKNIELVQEKLMLIEKNDALFRENKELKKELKPDKRIDRDYGFEL